MGGMCQLLSPKCLELLHIYFLMKNNLSGDYINEFNVIENLYIMQVTVWDEYQKICNKAEDRHIDMYKMERFEFYERAKSAYAIVATGESAQYANIILLKGVVVDKEKNED